MKEKVKYLLALVLASFGFGAGSAVLKLLLRDYPQVQSLDLVQIRLLFSGLILLLAGACQEKKLPAIRAADIRRFAILGIPGIFVVQFFLMYSVSKIYVGLATFTQSTATLMICAYSVVVLKERMSAQKGIALLLGFGGLAAILWSPEVLRGGSALGIGILTAFISALGKCLYILYGKVLQKKYNSMVMVGYAMLFGAIFALLGARPWRIYAVYGADMKLFLYVGIYVLLCTVLPFYLYFEGLKHIPVSIAGITNIVEPVGGTVMAFFLTAEMLKSSQFFGILLILAGVLLAQSEFLWAKGRNTDSGEDKRS